MILEIKGLNVFTKEKGKALLRDVTFSVKKNSCLGILGESGSGKSLTCKALMGLLDENFHLEGDILFENSSLMGMNEKQKEKVRGKEICMIIQNPMSAFNPLFTLENQLLETLRTHLAGDDTFLRALIVDAFGKMNLHHATAILKKYPHQLSGGMLQRIMIALCIALKPKVIIADEPTTAIDVVNQVEVIKELKNVRELFQTTMIFVSHDLSILSQMCDELIVMHQGCIIERGCLEEIIFHAKEDVTKELISTRLKLIQTFRSCVEDKAC